MSRNDVLEHEKHLLAVLSGERFLKMEGLGNEVPFFIYPYMPQDALEVETARKRLANKLETQHGLRILAIDLYDLSVELLQNRGVWDRLIQAEPDQDKADFRELLQSMLDSEQHLAPAVKEKIENADYDILFLTGIGEVFPYIRSHNVLNNLQSVSKKRPMLMFFPGEYKQSETLGSALVLFGLLKDDQYYRAKNIVEQEP